MGNPFQIALIFLLLALAAAGAGVYHRLFRRIQSDGGRVRTAEFAISDLLLTTGILTCLLGVLSYALLKPQTPPAADANPLPDAISFAVVVSLVAVFLQYRGISVRLVLGLDRLSPLRAIALGLGLLAAAFPLILTVSFLSQLFLQDAIQEQPLVTLFRSVARKSDFPAMGRILLSGVILAPLTEEFLFRGYFYGTLKRFAGARTSALFTCALFAAIHLNLSSLAGLFVLALCLTAAYEATGCWLVPVTMHAGFNLAQLGYLYWQAAASP